MAGLRVGLTGGIASGKSTVSERLRALGAVVIDYDQLARDAVEPGSDALAAIVERFGPTILRDDGTLDRPALGVVVFADASALRDLEAITHPAIGRLAQERIAAIAPGSVVVHDHPLLIETGADENMDVVVVVDVDVDVQVERMVRDRNMSEGDARARLAAQVDRAKRRAAADIIIENSGTIAQLRAHVDEVWNRLLQLADADD